VKSGSNIFLIVALALFGIALLASAAAFAYEKYLEGARDAKAAQLVKAQEEIDRDTIENFIRLRNRLQATESILGSHVLLSRFFTVLETRALQSVQFKSLKLTVDDDRTAEIQMSGIAKSFNALAAQSASFASEKRIKSAIFSDIGTEKDSTIHFSLSAELDPKLITGEEGQAFAFPSPPTPIAAPAPVATATPPVPPVPSVPAVQPQATASSTQL
jgi:Tfp pilus assembly protein PilE